MNGGSADAATKVRQAIRQSAGDLAELMRRAERADFRLALCLGLQRQDPELLAVHLKGWHHMIHGFR